MERLSDMESRRGTVLFVVIAVALTVMVAGPCPAEEGGDQKSGDIWLEDESRGPEFDGGSGRRRFDLSEEEIDRIMRYVRQADPEKAKELETLRKTDREGFQAELRAHGREEFAKIVRERIENWRRRRQDNFIKWLEQDFKNEAKELAGIKDKDPGLYNEKFDLAWNKYRTMYEAGRANPDLAKVLKEDFELRKRQADLVRKINDEKDDERRKQLGKELYDLVADPLERTDLSSARAEKVAEMRETLAKIHARKGSTSSGRGRALPPLVRARLKALGYLQ